MEERDYSDIEETGRELSDPAGPLPPEGEPGKAKRYLVWLSEIALTLLVVLVLNTVVLRLVLVEGNSMYPSLHHRDFLILCGAPGTHIRIGRQPQSFRGQPLCECGNGCGGGRCRRRVDTHTLRPMVQLIRPRPSTLSRKGFGK